MINSPITLKPAMNHRILCLLLSYWLFMPSDETSGAATKASNTTPTGTEKDSSHLEVNLYENLDSKHLFDLTTAEKTLSYTEPAFGFVTVPTKYSRNALPLDRSTPFALETSLEKQFPPGRYQFRLRSKGRAQLTITQAAQTINLQTKPQRPNKSSHDALPPPPYQDPSLPTLRPATVPHQEIKLQFYSDGTPIHFQMVAIIGGKGLVPSPSELSVSVALIGEVPILLSPNAEIPLTNESWLAYRDERLAFHQHNDDIRRAAESAEVTLAWDRYHESIRQWAKETLPDLSIPALDETKQAHTPIDAFILARMSKENRRARVKITDLEFLRRVSLDLTGRLPTELEMENFLKTPVKTRRKIQIETYLTLPDWADHWVSYWQDVLAENPGILKPDLNNSGPFRWWLQQSFEDNLPMDRLVAELIQMKGSPNQGAPAAFAMATLNDAPMAAKADILIQAFQAEKLSCARCHDSPEHRHKQLDTFSIAAMLKGKALKLPKSSTVPIVEGFRKPRIEISLEPGQTIHPIWPFKELSPGHYIMGMIPLESNVPETRNEVARHMISPTNERFAEVLVNRVWKRYLGAGLVEPAEDWENQEPSHPALLKYLAREFMLSGYDLKQLARLILNSETYQSQPIPEDLTLAQAARRHFAGPNQKRLTAEQLVDSLFLLAGKPIASEELNLNPLGDRPLSQFLNLGVPKRAWEFAALMNERDRPSLALPSAQAVVDVLTVYGWRQSRMNPLTDREDDPSPLQTLILANGVVGSQISRLTDDNQFTELAIKSKTIGGLIDTTVKRILTRPASSKEQDLVGMLLQPHFEDRIVPGAKSDLGSSLAQDRRVSWANHFDSKSNSIRLAEERQLRLGIQPTKRLTESFREAYEDFIWSLINSSEFITIP